MGKTWINLKTHILEHGHFVLLSHVHVHFVVHIYGLEIQDMTQYQNIFTTSNRLSSY